ncbi:MAG: YigZ family protein [Bacteroidales bacterium]|jgi:uncharacterized YigZ family protein|nr:YigZ family protein [Bacteroidales bacterium]
MPTDTYRTIANPVEGIYKDKGSKFLAFAFPVSDKHQAEEYVAGLRKKYFDARHHCYAYRIGENEFRINDDGEPSGTAGKPIYGQILSQDITNILIVVVRYFGGTLLGTSGLIKAYKNATADALQNASIIECVRTSTLTINFPYEKTSAVMKILKDNDIIPPKPLYNESGTCTMEIEVRLRDYERIKSEVAEF